MIGGTLKRIYILYAVSSFFLSFLMCSYVLTYFHLRNKIEIISANINSIFNSLSELKYKLPETIAEENIRFITENMNNKLSEVKAIVEKLSRNEIGFEGGGGGGGEMDVVRNEIARPDFCLDSLGARIVMVEHKPIKNNFLFSLFGFNYIPNAPNNILNPSMSPGDCFAFKGTSSNITIRLSHDIFIDAVSVWHILDVVSPTGDVKSAPKDFLVYGIVNFDDKNPHHLGTFSYDIQFKKSMQYFTINALPKKSFRFIKLMFLTNHGHPNHTCIYRVSVFGKSTN